MYSALCDWEATLIIDQFKSLLRHCKVCTNRDVRSQPMKATWNFSDFNFLPWILYQKKFFFKKNQSSKADNKIPGVIFDSYIIIFHVFFWRVLSCSKMTGYSTFLSRSAQIQEEKRFGNKYQCFISVICLNHRPWMVLNH